MRNNRGKTGVKKLIFIKIKCDKNVYREPRAESRDKI